MNRHETKMKKLGKFLNQVCINLLKMVRYKNSYKSNPGSRRRSIRSLAKSFLRDKCSCRAFSLPPSIQKDFMKYFCLHSNLHL